MAHQPTLTPPSGPPDRHGLSIGVYEEFAGRTDRLKEYGLPLDLPFLGLFGETGGVLTEAKKPSREKRPTAAHASAIKEEFGDVLWYLTAMCRRINVPLTDVFVRAAPEATAAGSAVSFTDLQTPFLNLRTIKIAERLDHFIEFAGTVGAASVEYAKSRKLKQFKTLEKRIVGVARALLISASVSEVDLQDVAIQNLAKILGRWPIEKNYPPLLDREDNPMEQIPRKLRIEIFERQVGQKVQVFQRCNKINIGDPLTDNKADPDDYRFHDVFHYAYATKLGWSPVTRALFKLKRKSSPEKDENQDGARAILIEEGISSWVFGQALNQHLFEDIEIGELSYDLLKTVQHFVSGYEVENQPLWLWEEAILAGFECFRYLKSHREGVLELNLDMRTFTIHDRTP